MQAHLTLTTLQDDEKLPTAAAAELTRVSQILKINVDSLAPQTKCLAAATDRWLWRYDLNSST